MSRFIYPLCSQNYCFSLSTCVKAQQNAWPGNRFVKCADAYKCRRKFMGKWIQKNIQSHQAPSIGLPRIRILGRERSLRLRRSSFWRLIQDSCQRIVWDAATCGGTLNYKHDEPTSFFFSLFPFLFLSSHLPCLVLSLSACSHVPAKELFSIFVSVDLCWSAIKRMTGKSLCEMRGWV